MKQKQNNTHKSLLLIIVMISFLVSQLLFLVGCATTKKDWEKAQRLNTIEAYQEFLQKHPDSEFVYEAKRKIEELAWERAKEQNTIEAYQEFLQKHPDSEFVYEAKRKIEELAWERAKEQNTIEAYQEFLQKHPDSEFAYEAKRKIEELAWERAKEQNTIEAYQEFIDKYPQSKFIREAKNRIEELAWNKTQKLDTIEAYQEFIRTYPYSKFVSDANEKIIKLYVQQSIKKTSLVLSDIQIDNILSSTDITISQPEPGGLLKITGNYEFTLGLLGVQPNMFGIGARHKFVGRVEMQGRGLENYVFIGDENDPLTFMVMENGYTYVGGKGCVIIKKTGEVICLGF